MFPRALALVVVLLTLTPAALAYRTSSWMPLYATGGLESTQLHAARLSESNPVWYQFDANGAIVPLPGAEDATWRAAMTGTEVLPTVQNLVNGGFDQALAVEVLGNAALREAHVRSIFEIVVSRAYDGIDIDYERLPYSSRADFTAFLETLATKLHSAGKKLSVTVYAKTSDSPAWDGAGGHDYAAIGRVADLVKLMVYPYSYSGTAPGPLTPLQWLDDVVTYAESVIPPSKIMVGLPWYGKDWNGTTAKSITYPKAQALLADSGAVLHRDANGEATFRYSTHTVYFNDAHSHGEKVDLILERHPGVAGFAHWAAGQEDRDVWTRVGALKNASSSTPPAATAALIASRTAWRYLDDGSDQGTAWTTLAFDDGGWRSGVAQFGYGDYDETTIVSYGPSSSSKFITTYFRRAFDVSNPAEIAALQLRLLRDDGAVVHLNGTEVFRSNMPGGAVGYRTLASGNAADESSFLEAVLDPRLLLPGRNVIAVEIHQAAGNSSDISFDLELTATMQTAPLSGTRSSKRRSVRS